MPVQPPLPPESAGTPSRRGRSPGRARRRSSGCVSGAGASVDPESGARHEGGAVADALLVAPVGTELVFDSHAAVVVLAVSPLGVIARSDPKRTQERLEAHEALVDRWIHPE